MSDIRDLQELKREFDHIQVPEEEIDTVIYSALKRGRHKKRLKLFKPVSIAAAIILAFILSVNISPSFADYMRNIPVLDIIVDSISVDRGVQRAAENGMAQYIGKSVEDRGIKLTIESIILDKKRLVIAYTVESDRPFQTIHPYCKVLKKDGESLGNVSIKSSGINIPETGDKGQGTLDIRNHDENFEFPEKIIVSCDVMDISTAVQQTAKYDDGNWVTDGTHKRINGKWEIPIKINKEFFTNQLKAINIQKNKDINGLKLYIEKAEIYPLSVNVTFSIIDEEYKLVSFKNPYLEDDKGNQYRTYYSAGYPDKYQVFYFESTFFVSPKSLVFKCDGMYYMPSKDQYITVDLDEGKILDNSGYDIKFASFKKANRGYELRLKTDDAISSIQFENKAYDEKHNVHITNTYSLLTDGDELDEMGITFSGMKKRPHLLKLKIHNIYKNLTGPFTLELQ